MVGFGKGRAGYVGLALVDAVGGSSLTASETTLSTLTLPANSLYKNGQSIRVKAFGTFAANANNKEVKLYFGTTSILDTGTLTSNNKSWYVEALIMRSAVGGQSVIASGRAGDAIIAEIYTALTKDAATDLAIAVKGTAATGASDIVCKGMIVEALTV